MNPPFRTFNIFITSSVKTMYRSWIWALYIFSFKIINPQTTNRPILRFAFTLLLVSRYIAWTRYILAGRKQF
jgi:hypothetical protein